MLDVPHLASTTMLNSKNTNEHMSVLKNVQTAPADFVDALNKLKNFYDSSQGQQDVKLLGDELCTHNIFII